jgi:hypothetical protein
MAQLCHVVGNMGTLTHRVSLNDPLGMPTHWVQMVHLAPLGSGSHWVVGVSGCLPIGCRGAFESGGRG